MTTDGADPGGVHRRHDDPTAADIDLALIETLSGFAAYALPAPAVPAGNAAATRRLCHAHPHSRSNPKWVVSRSLTSVGPHDALVDDDDLQAATRQLKAGRNGDVEVAGPPLAGSLTELGLIDVYRRSLHPIVLGHGKPYFAASSPPLRLVANDQPDSDVIRLTYVPA